MLDIDLIDETNWTTENNGLEYIAYAPVIRPPLLDTAVTVTVTCEKQPFSLAERVRAQRRVRLLREQISTVIDRLMTFTGEPDLARFHERMLSPTLLLRSGTPDWCAFCMDPADGGPAVFVEWSADTIVSVWRGE